MQTEYNDKSMKPAATKAEPKLQEFFYPGEMAYEPMTIKARDQVEADALYEKERKAVK